MFGYMLYSIFGSQKEDDFWLKQQQNKQIERI